MSPALTEPGFFALFGHSSRARIVVFILMLFVRWPVLVL